MLKKLARAASPLDKLEHLLDACAAIYNHAARSCGESVAAEDFLPLLAWLLARAGFQSAEIEVPTAIFRPHIPFLSFFSFLSLFHSNSRPKLCLPPSLRLR